MTAVEVAGGVTIDRAAVLRSLNLNPADPNTQALLVVCERYGLDPLLKHMVLIQGRPYVTRDGYLAIAHQSHQLDGIEIVDEGEDDSHWWARVSVYRKDMGRPFTYKGRYPKAGSGNKQYGPEMAIKCAEVAALRRAFNVTGIGAADERWDAQADEALVVYDPLEGWESRDESVEQHQLLKSCIAELEPQQREQVRALAKPWPMSRPDFDEVEDLIAELGRVADVVDIETGEILEAPSFEELGEEPF